MFSEKRIDPNQQLIRQLTCSLPDCIKSHTTGLLHISYLFAGEKEVNCASFHIAS